MPAAAEKITRFRRAAARSVFLCLPGVMLISGCTATPTVTVPPLEPPTTFSITGTEAPSPDWWKAFEDTQLNNLVELALGQNFDLRAGWSRLEAARASARQSRAGLFPEGSGTGGATYTDDDSGSTEELSLGVMATYELDLWGGIKAASDAEVLLAKAEAWDFQAAALSISAEITDTYFALLASDKRGGLLESQVEANRKALHLLERRFAQGQSGSVDVLRQRQLLAGTIGELEDAEAEQAVLKNRLAVLLGRAPSESVVETLSDLPTLPSLPATGLPLELVRRRPDLQAAHHRLLSANRSTAAAVSRRFPRISLSASYTTEDNDVQNLFDDWVLNLAGSLAAPLLDGGKRKAAVRQAEAEEDEQLYRYGQTVLTAFREVEDALAREIRQANKLGQLEQQVRFAEQSLEQLTKQYLNGEANFIDVLTARTDAQQLDRRLVTARYQLLSYRVALYRALAGSMELELEEEE